MPGKDEGGTQRTLYLTAELFLMDRFREEESPCLQLCMYWQPHQASMGSNKSVTTQMTAFTTWVMQQDHMLKIEGRGGRKDVELVGVGKRKDSVG